MQPLKMGPAIYAVQILVQIAIWVQPTSGGELRNPDRNLD